MYKKNISLTSETVAAYMKRFHAMQKYKNSKEGDDLFIEKMVAISEHVENMHIIAKINNFTVHNDGPTELGGTNKGPCPMESLLASLANCLELTAVLYLNLMGAKVKSVKVKVEACQDKRSSLNPKTAPFPGFYDFKITWYIDSNDDLKKIERIIKNVEDSCPVKGTVTRHQSFPYNIKMIGKNNESN